MTSLVSMTMAVAVAALAVAMAAQAGGDALGVGTVHAVPLVAALVGPEEVVFAWEEERCEDEDIPDSGLRLFRRADDQVVAIASHTRTRLFDVDGQGRFERDCNVVFESDLDPDPARHADATWIAATWTRDGEVVHALGHNEYRAHRHWFACRHRGYTKCWYNTIVALRSDDGGRSFRRLSAEPIAAPPFGQDAHQGEPRGYFDPTGLVEHDSFLHTIVFASGGPDQSTGNCLFRTDDIARPERWTFFDGRGFVPSSRDPYGGGEPHRRTCAPLANLDGRVAGLVRHRASGLFIATLAAQAPGADAGWVGVSVSSNLLDWSRPQIIAELPTIWSGACSNSVRYGYPSLLDLASHDRNFSTIGDEPSLFLTRIRVESCGATLHRDLVRFPVRISQNR